MTLKLDRHSIFTKSLGAKVCAKRVWEYLLRNYSYKWLMKKRKTVNNKIIYKHSLFIYFLSID